MRRVGVLALQGDVREHARVLSALDVETVRVNQPGHLDQVAGLIIPGGESTTIGTLALRFGLLEPLAKAIADGLPTFGTCAGLIFLSARLTEGEQPLLGVLDVTVQRNAFGRQNESFEMPLEVAGFNDPFPGVFIRAPWVAKVGNEVEVLAEVDGHPVMVREANVLASSFHPEMTGDTRIHQMFLEGSG
jgi:5'-phosphate synthase pdxT subunit